MFLIKGNCNCAKGTELMNMMLNSGLTYKATDERELDLIVIEYEKAKDNGCDWYFTEELSDPWET